MQISLLQVILHYYARVQLSIQVFKMNSFNTTPSFQNTVVNRMHHTNNIYSINDKWIQGNFITNYYPYILYTHYIHKTCTKQGTEMCNIFTKTNRAALSILRTLNNTVNSHKIVFQLKSTDTNTCKSGHQITWERLNLCLGTRCALGS